ncbi:MAG: Sua5/YciO/YrdC/YwlC family protein [Betaproteobacteria bacterium]|nr:Sua5/YciO/YrdC/YwlC family protein [Betaproteobacteria bacterium]
MRLRPGAETVLAYPTESCYGLGCDPLAARAVRRILRLKQRPEHKGVILIAADVRQLVPFVQPQALREAGMSGIWPAGVTLLLPASRRCPSWIRGRHGSVAVRVTAHGAARRACLLCGHALVSTSANRAGQRPARTAREIERRFGAQVRRLPGRIGKARRPSRIVDWRSGRVLRE